MSHHLVEMRDVWFGYPDGTEALRGVSFRITHGESVALVGGNGAGKSTLLLHLIGILRPVRGEVRVGDVPVIEATLPQVRRAVGYVFQDPDDQLFMPTVREDVAFGPVNMGVPAEDVERRVRDALEQVRIGHLADRPPYRLSAGEKRAAAIATVLSMTPDVLVMDEPSANLDPRARRRLIELLRGFRHTKILATHDLELVRAACERVIVLDRGGILADGVTSAVLADGAVREALGIDG